MQIPRNCKCGCADASPLSGCRDPGKCQDLTIKLEGVLCGVRFESVLICYCVHDIQRLVFRNRLLHKFCKEITSPCRDNLYFILRGLFPQKIMFWHETVTFCAVLAPPNGQSESAFGNSLNILSSTSNLNLVSNGCFVGDIWPLLCSRPLPLTLEACQG